jgi:hypothetical protein
MVDSVSLLMNDRRGKEDSGRRTEMVGRVVYPKFGALVNPIIHR